MINAVCGCYIKQESNIFLTFHSKKGLKKNYPLTNFIK